MKRLLPLLRCLPCYGLLMLSPWPVFAGNPVIEVNSLVDPGNGVCDASQCTLREAIAQATTAGGATDIVFRPGLSGTITLGSSLLVNVPGVRILGPGARVLTLSGNQANRVLFVNSNGNGFELSGLTIANGNTSAIPAPQSTSGAGLFIFGADQVVLRELRVIDNVGPISGAGISASGASLQLLRSEISGNQALSGSGMEWTGFGDTLLIENTTIQGNTGNQAASGLRITTNNGDQLTLRHNTIAGNLGNNTAGISLSVNAGASASLIGNLFAAHGGTNVDLGAFVNAAGQLVVLGNVVESTNLMLPQGMNLVGVEARLGAFDFPNAGAASRVFVLDPVSPAIDWITPGQLGCGVDVLADQLGQIRPQLNGCDAGAFEASSAGPVAVADSGTVFPGLSLAINVAANDFEPGGAIVPASVLLFEPPLHGAVSNPGDGRLIYTPAPGFGGPQDSFSYTIMDDDGELSLPGTVTLSFVPLADPALQLQGPPALEFNQPADYFLSVENLGAAPIADVQLQTQFDARFSSLDWTCTALGVSACAVSGGSGEINLLQALEPGAALLFQITGVITEGMDDTAVIAGASLSLDANTIELNMTNNQAMTSAPLALFRDGFEA